MAENTSLDYEPGVLRVFQSKDETKAFYNKIAKVYDLLAEHSEQPRRQSGIRKSQTFDGFLQEEQQHSKREGDRILNTPSDQTSSGLFRQPCC